MFLYAKYVLLSLAHKELTGWQLGRIFMVERMLGGKRAEAQESEEAPWDEKEHALLKEGATVWQRVEIWINLNRKSYLETSINYQESIYN